jgi:thioredoxin 1
MAIKIIKFSSTWCAPCKLIAPIFEKISGMDEFKDVQFQSFDIETDEEGIELIETYNIKNVPTIVVVNSNGNVLRKIIGAIQEKELVSILKETINNAI